MSTLLEQASLIMIPSGYKEDVVYSVIPETGAGDLSFTRASNGTRINSAGLVEVTPWNLINQGGTFNVSPWVYSGGTTLTGGFTDVNGTSNAFRYQSTGGGYRYGYNTSASIIAGQVYTHSVYARAVSGTQSVKLTDAYQGGNSIVTLTTEWQRLTYTLTASGGNLGIEIGNDGNNAMDIYICFSQTNLGTAKPYFPTTDRLNVPRLTYQNGGGGCPSLLLEKQSTNLVSYSEQFENAYFEVGSAASVTANTTTSPDGTQNADTLTANGTGSIFVRRNVHFGTGQTCAHSIFAKKNNNRYVGLRNSGTTSAHDVFDFDTKTWTNNSGAVLSYDELPNGWFRLKSVNTDAVNLNYYWSVLPAVSTAGVESTTASNLTIYIWGAQAEASSYPTSYIPTTSASATRVADACSKTGIGSLFGTNQGTFFIDLMYYGSEQFGYLFDVTDSANTNRFLMYDSNGSGLYMFYDSSYAQITTIQLTKGQRYRIGVKYNSSGTFWYVNGVFLAT